MSSAAVTPQSSTQDSKTVPVPAHLIPLPDSRPPTPDLNARPPYQSPSSDLSLQETGNEDKGTRNFVRDPVQHVDPEVSAFSLPPNVRPISNHRPWSRPPSFMIGTSDAVVNEWMRKAFCAETGRPFVPLRSHIIPTPASFGESRESLEARRAELKRAGHSFYQIEGDDGRYRINPETHAWEVPFAADQCISLKNFPTYVIRVCREVRGSTGSLETRVVSFFAHRQVLAAFFAHLGPKLEFGVTISSNGFSTGLFRYKFLPVFPVSHAKPSVYKLLLKYVYEQNPEVVLKWMLGIEIFSLISLCTEEIYQGTPRTISALPIAERRAAVQMQVDFSNSDIRYGFSYVDKVFDLADELGLESPPFWNALACVRRIFLDAGAISSFLHLTAMANDEAASCV